MTIEKQDKILQLSSAHTASDSMNAESYQWLHCLRWRWCSIQEQNHQDL